MRPTLPALVAFTALSCGAEPSAPADAAVALDAAPEPADAALPPDSGSPKAAPCASTFGSALTNAFGRIDGTVVAVVGPTDRQCTLFNDDHLVVQLSLGGAVHRVVVNVRSDGRNGTDTRLRYAELHRPLVGGPWSEGWHPGLALDYAADLDAHSSADFAPVAMDELVRRVSDRLTLGARVSVFATSSGGSRASSAHLVHRGAPPVRQDGALVIDPEGAEGDPLYLLFHFDGSVF